MTAPLHPAASHHLPPYITAPGQTDVLMVVMAVFLIVAILGFGILFLRLHSLPERMAHRSHKLQFEIVAVLCLLALFTHVHLFWVAALLLALIDFPDFGGQLGRIAGSVERIAGIKPGQGAAEVPDETVARTNQGDGSAELQREAASTGIRPSEKTGAVVATSPALAPASTRNRSHA